MYKGARKKTQSAYMREVSEIQSAPPGMPAEINMVEAVVIDPKHAPLDYLPLHADIVTSLPIIKMPWLDGNDAHTLFDLPSFPAQNITKGILKHCQNVRKLGYANTDLKLENIMVNEDSVKFVDWGAICKQTADHSVSRTFVLVDDNKTEIKLTPLQTMQLHLIVTIAELGLLFLGEDSNNGHGVFVTKHDVKMGHTFCTKWLSRDDCLSYVDLINIDDLLNA